MFTRRFRGQQLDRGRHAGEEAPTPAPDAGPRGLPESPEEQIPVRLWPHHRLSPSWPLPSTPFLLQIPPPPPPATEGRPEPPSPSLPSSSGVGGQRKGGDPSPPQVAGGSWNHRHVRIRSIPGAACPVGLGSRKGFWNLGAPGILSTRGRGGQTTSGRCWGVPVPQRALGLAPRGQQEEALPHPQSLHPARFPIHPSV